MSAITNLKLSKGRTKSADFRVSPSGAKELKRCKRSWGFVYLENLRGGGSKAAQLGTNTHSELDRYFSGGEIDTSTHPGQLALSALEFYPSPENVDLIENELSFDHGGVTYRGFADLIWAWDGIPTVADHKTSKAPNRWGLISTELPNDIQALVYANWALEHYRSDSVNLQWTYMKTVGKPQAHAVRASLTRHQARENFEKIVAPLGQEASKLVRLFKAGDIKKANELEPNPNACGDFGGCPHVQYCERSRSDILQATFGKKEEKTMGLKDLLAAKHKKAPPGPTALNPGDQGQHQALNSPEAPKSPEIAREISKAVGQTPGNKTTKPENVRTVAIAAAGAQTPEEARERCAKALAQVGGLKLAPRDSILVLVCDGIADHFAPTKPKSSELGIPFAAGRTVNSLNRDGLIEVKKQEDGSYLVSPTDKGRSKRVDLPAVDFTPVPVPVSVPVSDHGDPSGQGGALDPADSPAPETVDAQGRPTAQPAPRKVPAPVGQVPIPAPLEGFPAYVEPTDRIVFMGFLTATGDAAKANELMDAFQARFP